MEALRNPINEEEQIDAGDGFGVGADVFDATRVRAPRKDAEEAQSITTAYTENTVSSPIQSEKITPEPKELLWELVE